jgi:hypothetical protein
MSTDLAERLLSWAQNEEMIDVHYTGHGLDCISAHDELKRLRLELAVEKGWVQQYRDSYGKYAADIARQQDEIEQLRQQAIEDDAALARAGYLHDKLSSLVRRFYRQCEDANVWFPMDTTLMRDAKRALGDE